MTPGPDICPEIFAPSGGGGPAAPAVERVCCVCVCAGVRLCVCCVCAAALLGVRSACAVCRVRCCARTYVEGVWFVYVLNVCWGVRSVCCACGVCLSVRRRAGDVLRPGSGVPPLRVGCARGPGST